MTTQQIKTVVCKHCDVSYPATSENFYKCRGRLDFSRCKECKKKYARENRKPDMRTNRKRDRKEYMRLYRLKKKIEKEKELEDSKVK